MSVEKEKPALRARPTEQLAERLSKFHELLSKEFEVYGVAVDYHNKVLSKLPEVRAAVLEAEQSTNPFDDQSVMAFAVQQKQADLLEKESEKTQARVSRSEKMIFDSVN